MDYYIQGDAANADKIKAAFEKLGYKTRKFDFRVGVLFYTYGKELHYAISDDIANIIKTHPDYKELELSVEPKFNVGDWIVATGKCVYLITKIDEFTVILVDVMGDKYEFGADLLNDATLWTVNDAKDGDVLVLNGFSKEYKWIGIFKAHTSDTSFSSHCHYNCGMCEFVTDIARCTKHGIKYNDIRPATNEERDILFAKMQEAGYTWDENKKELKKFPKKHYDFSSFHAGMPVLVRADNVCRWNYSVFSNITGNKDWQFAVCNGVSFTQCIPFEGNEHLLGTTDMPSDEYINW